MFIYVSTKKLSFRDWFYRFLHCIKYFPNDRGTSIIFWKHCYLLFSHQSLGLLTGSAPHPYPAVSVCIILMNHSAYHIACMYMIRSSASEFRETTILFEGCQSAATPNESLSFSATLSSVQFSHIMFLSLGKFLSCSSVSNQNNSAYFAGLPWVQNEYVLYSMVAKCKCQMIVNSYNADDEAGEGE